MGPADLHMVCQSSHGNQRVVVYTDQVVGKGSYCVVMKATLDQMPCAAKSIHRVLFTHPRSTKLMTQFQQECQILQDLKHPNIVQFLGEVQDPSTSQQFLLMELMKETLTEFLEMSPTSVPYHVQVNISHDIAQALDYLHRNGIIHRDICSMNVLLNNSHQAKLCDFIMAKTVSSDSSMTRPMTPCPGLLPYMPPDALPPEVHYSCTIDSFSLGVLLLEIATRRSPKPSSHTKFSNKHESFPVPEIERRKSDLDFVPAFHGFLPIIRECLKDNGEERPSAAQLSHSLGQLKHTAVYRQSVRDPSFKVCIFAIDDHGYQFCSTIICMQFCAYTLYIYRWTILKRWLS